MKNLFDILSNDERIIVLSDKETGHIYTWNQSLTLQFWRVYSNQGGKEEHDSDIFQLDGWEQVDIRVLLNTPTSFAEARLKAQEWQHNNPIY